MRKSFKFLVFVVLVLCFQTVNADWVKQRTNSFAWLRDIQFVSESTGWIVGTDGVILSTTDGGTTWVQLPKFTTDTFRQVHFTDQGNGWILCERNVFTRGQNATSYLRKTSDGGRTWERIEFEDAGRQRVTKLLFNSKGWGTAFGEGGIFFKLQEDGKTWKASKSAIHFLLLDGAYGSGSNGVIVGAGGTILFTEDNGLMWDKATLIGNNDSKFNSIFFEGDKLGWAVGNGGAIVATTGGGRLWRVQESGVEANLNDVFFSNSREGWAVGDDGTIIRTRNGGIQWDDVNSRVKHRLEKVYFYGSKGWIVGFGGTILSYSDNGTNTTDAKPTMQPRN
ncbi:MAG: hypothetical protein IPG67_03140 [Acidobacteria bacterium]|nr:hypothetical protein [Acidobacteriota bacterium]